MKPAMLAFADEHFDVLAGLASAWRPAPPASA
jgi:hypothetical protein